MTRKISTDFRQLTSVQRLSMNPSVRFHFVTKQTIEFLDFWPEGIARAQSFVAARIETSAG